jgi:hypothetical protein
MGGSRTDLLGSGLLARAIFRPDEARRGATPGSTLLDLHGPNSIYERVINEVSRFFSSGT